MTLTDKLYAPPQLKTCELTIPITAANNFGRSANNLSTVGVHWGCYSVSHPSVSGPLPPVEWEELRLLIIGSADGVRETIHELHCRGFAEAGAWSKLLPGPNAGEVMSILTRRRSRV